jgi:hypothetical protein
MMIVRPENPIAVQLYTVREAAREDFPGTLRRLAEGGARAVEFAGYGGMPIPELRALLDELGMRVAGSHVPLTAWEGSPRRPWPISSRSGESTPLCPSCRRSDGAG